MPLPRAVAFVLLLQALLLGWLGWTTCPNRTEGGHMGATAYLWKTLRFDVFHVNPPLTRIVSGLPVVLCRPQYDWDFYSSRPQDRAEWGIGRAFVTANRPEKTGWCFALARWSLIPLILLGGYCGARLSRDLYGDWAALVFLVLWCFSPLVLAWGGTICPDVVAAALGIVALYTLRQWLVQPTWTRAALAGVCLGLLPLTKLTWLLAFGLWPAIWGCATLPRLWRQGADSIPPAAPLRQLLVVLLLGLYTLNMGYLFDGTGRSLGNFTFLSEALRGQGTTGEANRFAGTWLGAVPLPLPAELVQGIDTQRLDFERGMPSYCGGQWSECGWWYYYLYATVWKMPLGTWGLALLAVLVSLLPWGYRAAWRDELLLLVPLAVLLITISSQSGISAHTRYSLPALPLLFLWLSKVGRSVALGHRCVAMLATLALAGMVTSSLWCYPHCLSYFNELAGGPRKGANYLLGSNVDWGQDLFWLEKWCQRHPEAQPLRVAYDGMYPLEKTAINSAGEPLVDSSPLSQEDLAADAWPRPGWYALSVNELYSPSEKYSCFLRFCPVALAGYSIHIYQITPKELNRLQRELPGARRSEASRTSFPVTNGFENVHDFEGDVLDPERLAGRPTGR